MAAIAQAAQLVPGYPILLPKPSMWLLIGPATMLCGIPLLAAGRALAWELGLRRRLWVVQLLLVATVVVPCIHWGHTEDLLALALVLRAVRKCLDGEWDSAALALALAVGMKQWAVLLVPIVVLHAPGGRRVRVALISLVPPVLLAAVPLAVDWSHASKALFFQSVPLLNPNGHHSVAYLVGSLGYVIFRPAAVAFAPALAWLVRRRTDRASFLASVAVVLLVRALLEPVWFGYYLTPGLAFIVLLAVERRIPLWRTAPGGTFLVAWSDLRGSGTGWWMVEVPLLAVVCVPLVATLWPRRRAAMAAGPLAAPLTIAGVR